ncbi:MAG: NAD-dependent epimerase/dehydratase family protein [Gaiellales bacterium]
MRLLLLGGTVFLGRHVAGLALERGHEVTLFTRGRTNPGLFPEAERLTGDRDGGLAPLAGREWDAAIDTSGYLPRVVAASAAVLAGAAGHYTFVSSVSAYDGPEQRPPVDESAPVGALADESVEEITGQTYGPLKVLCERAVQSAFPGRALVVRPGLIVGPHDPTDRFTYWPHRIADGREVLAPGDPAAPVQLIDVRDLAGWMLDMAESGVTGVFNASGPRHRLTMTELLERCVEVTGSGASLVWIGDEFLLERQVEPWTDLPLWLGGDPELAWILQADCTRAVAAGLRFRPLDETIADTLAWDLTATGTPGRWGFPMTREREAELLAAWCSRDRSGG